MRVAAVQSNYLPWRGYFDLIDSVDLFVIYDDVQYSKGTWRNRNRLKCPEGLRWITVPVRVSLGQTVQEVEIGRVKGCWREQHRAALRRALEPAAHFADAMAIWEAGADAAQRNLSRLNVQLIEQVCRYLRISTPLVRSDSLGAIGAKSERLLDLLRIVGATTYVSGPVARVYLDEAAFAQRGIRLEYKSYDYPAYPQLWGPFQGAVTVLDLIANTGPGARDFLSSRAPNEVVVP